MYFPEHKLPVIHVQHVAGPDVSCAGHAGSGIRLVVKPLPDETLIQKHFPNAFRETRY
jgi:hypothetical protein